MAPADHILGGFQGDPGTRLGGKLLRPAIEFILLPLGDGEIFVFESNAVPKILNQLQPFLKRKLLQFADRLNHGLKIPNALHPCNRVVSPFPWRARLSEPL